jgi:hypothetical protein
MCRHAGSRHLGHVQCTMYMHIHDDVVGGGQGRTWQKYKNITHSNKRFAVKGQRIIPWSHVSTLRRFFSRNTRPIHTYFAPLLAILKFSPQ